MRKMQRGSVLGRNSGIVSLSIELLLHLPRHPDEETAKASPSIVSQKPENASTLLSSSTYFGALRRILGQEQLQPGRSFSFPGPLDKPHDIICLPFRIRTRSLLACCTPRLTNTPKRTKRNRQEARRRFSLLDDLNATVFEDL